MADEQRLIELNAKPFGQRLWGYIKLSGPGYMQSAMTLGAGSIAACVVMGSLLGYELLWVQTAAILFGYILLAAVAKQTCHSGEGAYQVFRKRLHPALALTWGISALVATVLWHIPQYSLTANGVVALGEGIGLDLDSRTARLAIGVIALVSATFIVYLYTAGARGLRMYEMAVKILVWLIVIAFALVAFSTGVDWTRLFLGLTGISFVRDLMSPDGLDPRAIKPIVGGVAAAVGINMVFLYPYSILNKNWGKAHKELAYFDLMSGLVVPFLIATTFIVVAVSNTVGPPEGQAGKEAIRDVQAIIPVLGPTIGGIVGNDGWGHGIALLLVGVGMLGIGFSTIITHMLASGFICCELFGFDYRSRAKLWFSLIPGVGIVGVLFKFPFWAAITASSLAAVFMPLAILGFILLMNMPSYMGSETPHGIRRVLWNGVLVVYLAALCVASYFGLVTNWNDLKAYLSPPVEAAVLESSEEAAAVATVDRQPMTFQRDLMYSTFQFIVYPNEDDDNTMWVEHAAESAFEAVESLERRISVWKDDSQASRINELAATRPVQASQDVIDLIVMAQDLNTRTHGAFDVTVGPLVDLWGYYRKENHLPTQEEVDKAMALVGMDKVAVDREGRSVSFAKEGVRLDFGGIGKGLAVDAAAAVFRKYKIASVLINGGSSSILAIGAPPGKAGWDVKITLPETENEVIAEVVLKDESISTSGCYGKYIEFDGAKYCHIFDPRTGWPAPGVTSATSFCASAAEADGLSTAFVVLGKVGTEQYCREHPEVRALIVPSEGASEPVWINHGEEKAKAL